MKILQIIQYCKLTGFSVKWELYRCSLFVIFDACFLLSFVERVSEIVHYESAEEWWAHARMSKEMKIQMSVNNKLSVCVESFVFSNFIQYGSRTYWAQSCFVDGVIISLWLFLSSCESACIWLHCCCRRYSWELNRTVYTIMCTVQVSVTDISGLLHVVVRLFHRVCRMFIFVLKMDTFEHLPSC